MLIFSLSTTLFINPAMENPEAAVTGRKSGLMKTQVCYNIATIKEFLIIFFLKYRKEWTS